MTRGNTLKNTFSFISGNFRYDCIIYTTLMQVSKIYAV